ncbi:MAG: transposase [Chitinophagales bacterium]
MRSVPGVGPIVAAGILSELGDIRRFNAKEFAGYIGQRYLSKWRKYKN